MSGVLDTTELLEGVLAQLSPDGLLFAQRVCQRRRTLIAESPKLQRVLFLLTESKHVLIYQASNLPILGEHGQTIISERWTTSPTHGAHFFPSINPFFHKIFRSPVSRTDKALFNRRRLAWRNDPHSFGGIVGKPGLWKQMYITSPPIVELRCVLYRWRCNSSVYDCERGREILPRQDGEGLEMGDLVDTLNEVWSDLRECLKIRIEGAGLLMGYERCETDIAY